MVTIMNELLNVSLYTFDRASPCRDVLSSCRYHVEDTIHLALPPVTLYCHWSARQQQALILPYLMSLQSVTYKWHGVSNVLVRL